MDYFDPGTWRQGDARLTYAAGLPADLGCRRVEIAFAGTGYATAGGDQVPAAGTHWRNFDAIYPRDLAGFAPHVKYVLINYGTNDAKSAPADVTSAALALYSDVRAAFPRAVIFVLVPFGRFQAQAVRAAVQAFPDPRTHLIDLGSAASAGLTGTGPSPQSRDGVHPNAETHAQLHALVLRAIQAQGK